MSDKYIPEDAYVLVSQGVVIDWYFTKELALREAEKSNLRWLDYKQDCLEKHIPYADNSVCVYYGGELIANQYGEINREEVNIDGNLTEDHGDL